MEQYKDLRDYVSKNGHNKVLHYFDLYDSILTPFRYKPIKLLEIGVFEGQSMEMWKDYFPFAEITGLDIDPYCLRYTEERVKIVIGDQLDETILKTLGDFDIIIDDGGHTPIQIVKSFEILYDDFLNDGGWYFIEDINSAYHTSINRNPEFFRGLLDCAAVPDMFRKHKISELRCVNIFMAIRK